MSHDAIEIGIAAWVDEAAPQAEGHVRSDLDARQDEVLHLLDELNARIEAVIRDFAPQASEAASAAPSENRAAAA